MLTITTTTSASATYGIHRTMIRTRWVFGYFFNFEYNIRQNSGRKAHAMCQCHGKFLHRGQVAATNGTFTVQQLPNVVSAGAYLPVPEVCTGTSSSVIPPAVLGGL
jgi:hypothetical protein